MTELDPVRTAVRRAAPSPDTERALTTIRRRFRRRRVIVGAGALLAVVAGAVGALALTRVDSRGEPITPVSEDEGWVTLAAPPFGQSFSTDAAVWTGEEAIWWGGRGDRGDPWGAAYDPESDTWRVIAESPLDRLRGASVVWTGEEMVVWGGHPPYFSDYQEQGAAYDPESDSWRTIAPAPVEVRGDALAGWVGSAMVVVGGTRADGAPVCFDDGTCSGLPSTRWLPDGAAYDPITDSWREIAPIPRNLGDAVSVTSTDDELLVFNPLASYAYDVDGDRWRPLSRERTDGGELAPTVGTWMEAAGGTAVAVDTSFAPVEDGVDDDGLLLPDELSVPDDAFFLYRPELDRWEPAPEGFERPPPPQRCEHAVAAVGEALVMVGCTHALIDPSTGEWDELPLLTVDEDGPAVPIVVARDVVGGDDLLMLHRASTLTRPGAPVFLGHRFSEPPP